MTYQELREKALAFNSTKEDRLALFHWFETNDGYLYYWNGECFDLGDGLSLYPVYDESDGINIILVDAEIR